MYENEKTIIKAIIHMLLIMNLILTILNSVLIQNLNWNPPPTYFSDLLLICHLLATDL
jgi:hypothetical protein